MYEGTVTLCELGRCEQFTPLSLWERGEGVRAWPLNTPVALALALSQRERGPCDDEVFLADNEIRRTCFKFRFIYRFDDFEIEMMILAELFKVLGAHCGCSDSLGKYRFIFSYLRNKSIPDVRQL